ncbi:hypothetical protein E1295_15300 [Nonomuraea mesophila]|uniref:Uncharacterized protein n=1 Tax=Nonomuraea mesophila TaxID=2530382 RepID=A0A4R5FP21_9ACTN|nr:hypothetical protein [Nonomuraea mesophila]TDE54492.1 hypothetical protein E1295_15300 [Nonomuraea mesophila]
MFLPVGQGVASASAGYVAVEAGGPPSAPVRHVSKPRRVSKEKPILRSPRWRPPKIDIIVHNLNRNKNKHRRHHHRPEVRVEQVQPPVVDNNDTQPDERDHRDRDHRDRDHRDRDHRDFDHRDHERDGWWPIDGDLTGW